MIINGSRAEIHFMDFVALDACFVFLVSQKLLSGNSSSIEVVLALESADIGVEGESPRFDFELTSTKIEIIGVKVNLLHFIFSGQFDGVSIFFEPEKKRGGDVIILGHLSHEPTNNVVLFSFYQQKYIAFQADVLIKVKFADLVKAEE